MNAATFYFYAQFIIAGFALCYPLFLILTDRRSALAAWICICCCVDVFNARLFVNFPAAPMAGLLLLPITTQWLTRIVRTHSGRALLLQFGYLVLLGIIFGYLTPWSDNGIARAFNETAPGRALVYLVHLLGNLSVAVFIADYIRSREDMARVLRYVLVGTTFASGAGLASYLTGMDFYRIFTGFTSQQTVYRLHGLNYEPRGLGLIAVYGLAVCIALLSQRRSLGLFLALLANAAAIFMAVSISALGAAAAALLGLVVFHRRSRLPILVAVAVGLALVATISAVEPAWEQQWVQHTSDHEVGEVQQSGANNWFEVLAIRTGAFDAGALLFLRDHPWYLLTGTGPGLIVLPDTEEVAKLPIYQWIWAQNASAGIIVPPTIGLVLEVSNGGVVDLLLMLSLILAAWRSFGLLAVGDEIWNTAGALFIAAICIYAAQAATVSAMPYLLLGSGLAAERLARIPVGVGAFEEPKPSGVAAALPALG